MKKILHVCLLFCILIVSGSFLFEVHGSGAYTISNYQIQIDVDKSAVLSVEETIQLKDCAEGEFHKDILQDYSYDANMDGEAELYSYGIESIHVEGHEYATKRSEGKVRVSIQVPQENTTLHLRYQVRMRKFDAKDANLFLYQLISSTNEGTIEQLQAKIVLQSRPDTSFDVSMIDQSGTRKESLSAQIMDKTIQVQTTQPIPPGQGIMIKADLRDFFFNYSHAISLSLYLTLFSILLFVGIYAGLLYSSKFHKKDRIKECYPIEQFHMGTLGYVVDGGCDARDIITILIEWANQNYIQIRDENQTITLVLVNELPVQAPAYEQHLFNLIFTNYTMVTIDQLTERKLKKKMVEIEQEIYQAQEMKQNQPIYTNASYTWQMLNALIVPIPVVLIMFGCVYQQNYVFSRSILYAIGCFVVVYLNCLPWVWMLKHQYRLSKNTVDVYRILISLINFICGGLIYSYLLINDMAVAYAAIDIVLTLLLACVMIFMDKPTFYGRTLRMRLLSLREFIRRAKSEQLVNLLYDNPYYFEDMLPYAYYFDITDIWGKKFTSIPLQAPFWYFHANASAQSTIFWMRSLETSLSKIQKALYQEEVSEKPHKLRMKAQKQSLNKTNNKK